MQRKALTTVRGNGGEPLVIDADATYPQNAHGRPDLRVPIDPSVAQALASEIGNPGPNVRSQRFF